MGGWRRKRWFERTVLDTMHGWVGGWVGEWVGGRTYNLSGHLDEVLRPITTDTTRAHVGIVLVVDVTTVRRAVQPLENGGCGVGGKVGGWVGGWVGKSFLPPSIQTHEKVGGWVGGWVGKPLLSLTNRVASPRAGGHRNVLPHPRPTRLVLPNPFVPPTATIEVAEGGAGVVLEGAVGLTQDLTLLLGSLGCMGG